ncbi:uncharacterized protein LOC119546013 [Drosophila subpulchrella]|uniref:uncharacterized protein LOC119546013 n=1 Tax=Drosophila subpulchrella TaxID=1486046 RepID=UPI0018A1626C|nr:uncharacterized protein LOC119546013 [Drosophila subpulchrella]XP_037707946.1 uncharacterized protein LOC119546013 [Drosophila subpulchrella]
MEEIKHRKFRGKNYTPEDEMVLLELVAEEKAVIQDPKSDAGTWTRKQRVWRDIEERFYLRTGNRRDYKALREKFISLKRQCRADLREKTIKEPKKGAVTELIVSMLHADSEKPTAEKHTTEKPVEDSSNEIDTSNIKTELIGDFIRDRIDDDDNEVGDSISFHDDTLAEEPATSSSGWSERMKPERGKEAPKGVIEQQKLNLILLQQEFLRTKTLQLKEMHEMVMEERRIKLNQEVREGKLRIELLELDKLERKAKLNIKT